MIQARFSLMILTFFIGTLVESGLSQDASPADPSTPKPSTVQNPEQIEQTKPPFYVRAELNQPDHVYVGGEKISLKIVSERDAYLYVMYRQSDGKVYQLFPNAIHKENFVKAKVAFELGVDEDRFRWVVSAPFGKESITVIASEKPLKDLSRKEQVARHFNPVTKDLLKGVSTVLSDSTWTNTHIALETRAKSVKPSVSVPDATPRRFGLFVGVSKHRYYEDEQALLEELRKAGRRIPKGTGSDSEGPSASARLLYEVMKSKSRLDEVRLLTNGQATRANIEEAITGWLANSSKPGDTVFIFFSGHTGQIPDDNGDESDHRDELLMAHDTISGIAIVDRLFRQSVEGTLADQKKRQLESLLSQLARAGLTKLSGREKLTDAKAGWEIIKLAVKKHIEDRDSNLLRAVEQFIRRSTCISDDLVGRWLQRLDGRRVVVLFDTCHAGGHATIEKSFEPSSPEPIDFLDNERSRLKDIGQRDLAILASSSVSTSSSNLNPAILGIDDMPVVGRFSFCLLKAFEEVDSQLSVEELFEFTKSCMSEIYAKCKEADAVLGKKTDPEQVPQLFNDLVKAVFLMPK